MRGNVIIARSWQIFQLLQKATVNENFTATNPWLMIDKSAFVHFLGMGWNSIISNTSLWRTPQIYLKQRLREKLTSKITFDAFWKPALHFSCSILSGVALSLINDLTTCETQPFSLHRLYTLLAGHVIAGWFYQEIVFEDNIKYSSVLFFFKFSMVLRCWFSFSYSTPLISSLTGHGVLQTRGRSVPHTLQAGSSLQKAGLQLCTT